MLDLFRLFVIQVQQIRYQLVMMRSIKILWVFLALVLFVAIVTASTTQAEEPTKTGEDYSPQGYIKEELKDVQEESNRLAKVTTDINTKNRQAASDGIDTFAEFLTWIAESIGSIFPDLSGSLSGLVTTLYSKKELMAGLFGILYTFFQLVFGGGVSYITSKMKNLNLHKETIEQGFDLQFRIFQKQQLKLDKPIQVSPGFQQLFQFLDYKDNKEIKIILGSTGVGFSSNINEWVRRAKSKDSSLRHIFYDMAEPAVRYNNANDNTHMECIKAIVYSLLHSQDRNFVLMLFKGIIEKVFVFCIRILRLFQEHISFSILYLSFAFYLRQIFYLIALYLIIYILVIPILEFVFWATVEFFLLIWNRIEQKSPTKKPIKMKLVIDNFQVLRSEYEERFHAGKLKHVIQGTVGRAPVESHNNAPDNSTFDQHKKIFIQNLTGFFNNVTALIDSSNQQEKTEVIIIVRNSEFYRQFMELLRLNSANPFKIKKFSQLNSDDINFTIKQRTFEDVKVSQQKKSINSPQQTQQANQQNGAGNSSSQNNNAGNDGSWKKGPVSHSGSQGKSQSSMKSIMLVLIAIIGLSLVCIRLRASFQLLLSVVQCVKKLLQVYPIIRWLTFVIVNIYIFFQVILGYIKLITKVILVCPIIKQFITISAVLQIFQQCLYYAIILTSIYLTIYGAIFIYKIFQSIIQFLKNLPNDIIYSYKKKEKDTAGTVKGIQITKFLQLFHNNSKEIMKLLREVGLDKKYCEDSGSPMIKIEEGEEKEQSIQNDKNANQQNNSKEQAKSQGNKNEEVQSKKQKKESQKRKSQIKNQKKRHKTKRENIAQVIRHSMAQILKHAELLDQLSNLGKDQEVKQKKNQKKVVAENGDKSKKDQKSELKQDDHYQYKASLRYIGLFLGCIHKQLILFANRREADSQRLQNIYEEFIDQLNKVDLDMLSTISTNNRHYLFERINMRFQMKTDARYLILKWDELIKYIKGDNCWADTLQRDFIYYYTENQVQNAKLKTFNHKKFHAGVEKDKRNLKEPIDDVKQSRILRKQSDQGQLLSQIKQIVHQPSQNQSDNDLIYKQKEKAQAQKIFVDIVDFLTKKEIISQHIFFSRSMALANYYLQQKMKEKVIYQIFQAKKCKLGSTIRCLQKMRTKHQDTFKEFCKIIGQVRTKFQLYIQNQARSYEQGMDWLRWYYSVIPKCNISDAAIEAVSKYLIHHSNNTYILRPFPNKVFLYWNSFSRRRQQILNKQGQSGVEKVQKHIDLLRSKGTLCAFDYFDAFDYEKTHTFKLLECSFADLTREIDELKLLEATICKRTQEKQCKENTFRYILNAAYSQLLYSVLAKDNKQQQNSSTQQIKMKQSKDHCHEQHKRSKKKGKNKGKDNKISGSEEDKDKNFGCPFSLQMTNKQESKTIMDKDKKDLKKQKITFYLKQNKEIQKISKERIFFEKVKQYLEQYEMLLKQYHPEGLFKELNINYRKNIYEFKNGRSFFLSEPFKNLIFAYHLMLDKTQKTKKAEIIAQEIYPRLDSLIKRLTQNGTIDFINSLSHNQRLQLFIYGGYIEFKLKNVLIEKKAIIDLQFNKQINTKKKEIDKKYQRKFQQLEDLKERISKRQIQIETKIQEQKKYLTECREREKQTIQIRLKYQNEQKKAIAQTYFKLKKYILLSDLKTQLAVFCYLS